MVSQYYDIIINLVKPCPWLYDKTQKNITSKEKNTMTWNEIADTINRDCFRAVPGAVYLTAGPFGTMNSNGNASNQPWQAGPSGMQDYKNLNKKRGLMSPAADDYVLKKKKIQDDSVTAVNKEMLNVLKQVRFFFPCGRMAHSSTSLETREGNQPPRKDHDADASNRSTPAAELQADPDGDENHQPRSADGLPPSVQDLPVTRPPPRPAPTPAQRRNICKKNRENFSRWSPKSALFFYINSFRRGPKLQRDIWVILLRWRTYKVGFCSDIRMMFRQIKVNKLDVDWHRTLWSPNSRESARHFQLLTVTYGTACAPYLSLRTLRQLCDDEGNKFPRARLAALRDCYKDDALFGADDVEDAPTLRDELIQLMKTPTSADVLALAPSFQRSRFCFSELVGYVTQVYHTDITKGKKYTLLKFNLCSGDGRKVHVLIWDNLIEKYITRKHVPILNLFGSCVCTGASIGRKCADDADGVGTVAMILIGRRTISDTVGLKTMIHPGRASTPIKNTVVLPDPVGRIMILLELAFSTIISRENRIVEIVEVPPRPIPAVGAACAAIGKNARGEPVNVDANPIDPAARDVDPPDEDPNADLLHNIHRDANTLAEQFLHPVDIDAANDNEYDLNGPVDDAELEQNEPYEDLPMPDEQAGPENNVPQHRRKRRALFTHTKATHVKFVDRGQCVAILQPRKICASIPGSPVRGHATNKYGPVTKPHIRETSDAPAMCSAKRARLQRRAGESCTATALLCESHFAISRRTVRIYSRSAASSRVQVKLNLTVRITATRPPLLFVHCCALFHC
ncbi:unnamed protein product [Trichogramma brassicae]|uniref:MADF domain-containing protein n=1 Tax=Trichogramma brassicae TaxID=86971 RepID=A0A6H5I9R5_9HYME|nr:unnamed protein product [Trichogramma brassicae]